MTQERCTNCVADFPASFCLYELPRGCNVVEQDDSGDFTLGFEQEQSSEDESERRYRDPVSTGRKRAAVMFPILPGTVCEWAWRKDCGGGVTPIVGCTGRPAIHIHHGPDKSTLNNDRETNISIVCNFCHNRWHSANDKYYVEPRPADNLNWIPSKDLEGKIVHTLSEMVKATKQEILINEMTIPEGGKDRG